MANPSPTNPPPTNFYNPNSVAPTMAPSTQPMMPNAAYMTPHKINSTPTPSQPPPVVQELEKKPIPEEAAVLQTVFDGILEKCRNVSKNPQAKRKLDDVKRKLAILYDLLRENKVSPNVLSGLHQICQACELADYQTGIAVHTKMISTGSFSEISSFMPGLKSLMQLANQLKV
jgi:protein transport protein SEC31